MEANLSLDLLRTAPTAALELFYRETLLWRLPLVLPLYRIGRDADNDIVLDDPTVSGRHAMLTPFFDELLVEDLGSKNGVLLHGERIDRGKLKVGERIRIGPFRLHFCALATAPQVFPWQPREKPSPLPAAPLLVSVQTGRRQRITKRVTRLGDAPDAPTLVWDGLRLLLVAPEQSTVRRNGAVARGVSLLHLGDHLEWNHHTLLVLSEPVSH
ncbi:hypothetical protein JCM16106_13740 [Hydrogenophilus islandicus]